jgi:uncharacterized protein (DUF488 family)
MSEIGWRKIKPWADCQQNQAISALASHHEVWKENHRMFPRLTRLARLVILIPSIFTERPLQRVASLLYRL